jgi:hypothetical protein
LDAALIGVRNNAREEETVATTKPKKATTPKAARPTTAASTRETVAKLKKKRRALRWYAKKATKPERKAALQKQVAEVTAEVEKLEAA